MNVPKLTLGIEEEYQIVDPGTWELAPLGSELIEEDPGELKPEFMQCQVEVGTPVCADVGEARREILRLRRRVAELAESRGLRMVAASTHPFSTWQEQQVTSADRYRKLEADLADVARRLLIFGMHVHIGIEDKDLRIDVLRQLRYFLPHLLALSTSSPFWHGRETGLRSYRSVIFGNMPRSGIPPGLESWSEYEGFLQTLIRTGCIDEGTKIWWDARPHAKFPTVEVRIFDICSRVDEVIALAALLQALVAKLILLRRQNRTWRVYRHHLVIENKWRAVRYGLDGKLLDLGQRREIPTRDLIEEILELVDDVLDPLGSREDVEKIRTILEGGSSADRQLATWRRTGDLREVVAQLADETTEGC